MLHTSYGYVQCNRCKIGETFILCRGAVSELVPWFETFSTIFGKFDAPLACFCSTLL